MLQWQDEFASERQRQKAKAKSFFLPFMCASWLSWIFLPQLIWSNTAFICMLSSSLISGLGSRWPRSREVTYDPGSNAGGWIFPRWLEARWSHHKPRCQTWSCRALHLPCQVLVLLWSNLSLLSYDSTPLIYLFFKNWYSQHWVCLKSQSDSGLLNSSGNLRLLNLRSMHFALWDDHEPGGWGLEADYGLHVKCPNGLVHLNT